MIKLDNHFPDPSKGRNFGVLTMGALGRRIFPLDQQSNERTLSSWISLGVKGSKIICGQPFIVNAIHSKFW